MGPPPPLTFCLCLLLRSAPPAQTAEHLAASEAPAGADGAQKGTQPLRRECLIQRWIEGMRRRIGGGSTIPHIFRLFDFAGNTRAPCSRRVLRGLRGSSAMTSTSTCHVVTLPPPPHHSLVFCRVFFLPPCSAYLLCSGLWVGLVFPTFTQGCETREAGERLEWEEGKTDAKQPEKRRKRAPRRSPIGELEQRAKLASTFLSPKNI